MNIATIQPAGIDRGVMALESIGLNDWGGLIVPSFDTTNTPDVRWEWQPRSNPPRGIDATLREATGRYDDLLRRLAD